MSPRAPGEADDSATLTTTTTANLDRLLRERHTAELGRLVARADEILRTAQDLREAAVAAQSDEGWRRSMKVVSPAAKAHDAAHAASLLATRIFHEEAVLWNLLAQVEEGASTQGYAGPPTVTPVEEQ